MSGQWHDVMACDLTVETADARRSAAIYELRGVQTQKARSVAGFFYS
jgi:hypothetical protein